ncbi:MAG: NifX-associated nitrogen fixation protein [Rhodospirillales bacterium]
MASLFVRALVRQLRAHDITGAWERKSDAELLAPYLVTPEQRRAMPVIGDPDARQLWRIEQYWAAAGLAVEQACGIIATPIVKLTHEGFGRAVLIAGRLVVASRVMRDVHRFGFANLSKLASEGEKLVSGAAEMIAKYPEPARD